MFCLQVRPGNVWIFFLKLVGLSWGRNIFLHWQSLLACSIVIQKIRLNHSAFYLSLKFNLQIRQMLLLLCMWKKGFWTFLQTWSVERSPVWNWSVELWKFETFHVNAPMMGLSIRHRFGRHNMPCILTILVPPSIGTTAKTQNWSLLEHWLISD